MNDAHNMLGVMLANPSLGAQHFAQDGMNRAPDLSRMDLLLQELARNSSAGGFSSPLNQSNLSAVQSLNPVLIMLLSQMASQGIRGVSETPLWIRGGAEMGMQGASNASSF